MTTEDKQREIKSDLGNRTINDVMNEFLLSMVNKYNGALIAELRIRWREFLDFMDALENHN